MSNPYQLVVFDWEGTISDTLGQIFNIVNAESDALGFGALDLAQARQCADLGLDAALKKLFPLLTDDQYQQLFYAVQRALKARPSEVCLIPGAMEFIEQLHEAKIDMAIATNKGHHSLMRALPGTGLDKFIQVTRSAGQVPAKPSPEMLIEIMDELDAEPKNTLMVGDTVTDMEMAVNSHVDAVGVDFYHQNKEVLIEAGAVEVFDDYSLLAKFLKLPK